MTDAKDIYWLAGLLEGDGSFSITRSANRPHPHIQLSMKDRDVVVRARRILGSYPVRTYDDKRPDRQPHWHEIRLGGRKAIGWMMTLYPLMGERRKARIRELLTIWRKD